MLTTEQYATLADDINNDRGNLAATINTTMAALTATNVTADTIIAGLYNAPSAANAVPVTQIGRDDFLHVMSAVVLQILTDMASSVPKSAKYGPVLQLLNMLNVIQLNNATLTTTFTNMITDGYVTQDQIAAIANRPGSRAEHLFGAGTILDHSDIARSMGRGW